MLPPLPPALSLNSKSNSRTNFSRPLGLTTSKSMPYLDPPRAALASPARRGVGSISRSRRIDLAGYGEDEDMEGGDKGKGKGKEQEAEQAWSPWKDRQRTMTPKRLSQRPDSREVCIDVKALLKDSIHCLHYRRSRPLHPPPTLDNPVSSDHPL